MPNLLKRGRKLVKVGRKLAKATAACISRCCGGDNREFYILNLCHTANAPPEVPRRIAVPLPFTCGGCPLSSRRIVIYRGYCYEASPNFDGACTPLPCAGGACESPPVPRSAVGNDPIVNPGELQCKPLDATCSTVPCVPEEPGCCSELDRRECPDGSYVECNRPKRFKIVRFGTHSLKSWCNDQLPDCRQWQLVEDVKIKWNFWHEYQCEETGGDRTQATCRAAGGSIVVSGAIDWNFGNVPSPLNGEWRATCNGFVRGSETSTASVLLYAMGTVRPCGGGYLGDACTNSEYDNCSDGRRFHRRTVSCSDTGGYLNESSYSDCNYAMSRLKYRTFDSPRCPGQPTVVQDFSDDEQYVFVTACPGDPPQVPLPEDARAFVPRSNPIFIPPASTGELF